MPGSSGGVQSMSAHPCGSTTERPLLVFTPLVFTSVCSVYDESFKLQSQLFLNNFMKAYRTHIE